jgi:outer membrane autotransporter protein
VDTSIQALSPDFAVPELINGLINTVEGAALRDVNSEHADIMFIDRLLDSAYTGTGSKGVDTKRATMLWNSVAGITSVSGINAYAIENQNNVSDRVEDHALTDAHARMDRFLWVDLVAGKSQTDRFQTTMPNKTGYKADSYGIILGADIAISADTVAGIALSYVKGDLKSKGSYLKTDSDAKAYGASLYASQKFGNAKVSGLFGFQKQNGKATQSFTDMLGNGYGISNKQDSKSIVLSVKAEYDFPVSKSVVVKPHVGLRYSYTNFDDSVIKINGKSAFNVDTDSKSLLKVPVGVAFEGNFKANGWNVSPKADLSVVPQFGNTSVSSKVSARSFKGSDTFSYDVTGKVAGELVLGVEAQNKAHTFGVYYKGSIGDKGRTSNSVNVGYRFSF